MSKICYWDEKAGNQKTRNATVAEEAILSQERADAIANGPIKKWKREIAAIEAEGVTTPIENIIDSMSVDQLARLDPFLKEIHTGCQ